MSRSMGKMNTESDEDDDDDEQDDEDDTSESSRLGRRRSISTDPLLTSPRPSKYQFYGELGEYRYPMSVIFTPPGEKNPPWFH